MEIRAARADETDELLRVLCAAFGLPFDVARPIFYRDPFFDLSHKRLLWTPEDGIVSCLTVIPCRLRVGAAWVSLGGIAGVATQPPHRGRGHAGRLLEATVGALADELRYPVSGLFALSEGLYRRFGWETATRAARRSVPLALLPRLSAHTTARAATDADLPAIRTLHAASAEARTGGYLRDDRRWRLIGLAGNRECVVAGPPTGITGYAYWERQADALHLLEMVGPADARHALLGFLARAEGKPVTLDWTASPADWNALVLPNDAETNSAPEPGLMLRLTDLPAALAAVHEANLAPVLVSAGRTLTVRASDPLRPENARPVRLTPAGVMPGQDDDPNWITADIGTLAPIYLGFRTPSEAHEAGQLTASSPEALAVADTLFPRRDPFVSPLDQF